MRVSLVLASFASLPLFGAICFSRRPVALKDARLFAKLLLIDMRDERGVGSKVGSNDGEIHGRPDPLHDLISATALSDRVKEKCESTKSRMKAWTLDSYVCDENRHPFLLNGEAYARRKASNNLVELNVDKVPQSTSVRCPKVPLFPDGGPFKSRELLRIMCAPFLDCGRPRRSKGLDSGSRMRVASVERVSVGEIPVCSANRARSTGRLKAA